MKLSGLKNRIFLKVVSVLLVVTFLNMQFASATPPGQLVTDELSSQGVFSKKMMTQAAEAFRESIFSEKKVLSSVLLIGKYFLGSESPEDLASFVKSVMEAELEEEFSQGISLENILPIEYLQEKKPQELKEVLAKIGLEDNFPDKGVVFIPYTSTRTGEDFIIQLAARDTLALHQLAGYEWMVSDKYVVKAIPRALKSTLEEEERKQPESPRGDKVTFSPHITEANQKIHIHPEKEKPFLITLRAILNKGTFVFKRVAPLFIMAVMISFGFFIVKPVMAQTVVKKSAPRAQKAHEQASVLTEQEFKEIFRDLTDEEMGFRARVWGAEKAKKAKDPRFFDPLVKILSKEKIDDVLIHTIRALAEYENEKAIEPLKNFLKSERCDNLWLRIEALKALNKLGDKSTIKDFRYFSIMEEVAAKSKSKDTHACMEAHLQLAKFKHKYVVDILIDNLKSDYWAAPGVAAIALARTEDPKNSGAYDALVNALEYPSTPYTFCNSLHAGVAQAFGELGDKRAIPHLYKIMANENQDRLAREKAIESLGILGGKKSTLMLIKGIKEIKNWHIRGVIAKELERINDPEGIKAVKSFRLIQEGSAESITKEGVGIVPDLLVAYPYANSVMENKIAIVIRDLGPKALVMVAEAINDENPYIKEGAANILKKIEENQLEEKVRAEEAKNAIESPDVREAITQIIEKAGGPETAKLLNGDAKQPKFDMINTEKEIKMSNGTKMKAWGIVIAALGAIFGVGAVLGNVISRNCMTDKNAKKRSVDLLKKVFHRTDDKEEIKELATGFITRRFSADSVEKELTAFDKFLKSEDERENVGIDTFKERVAVFIGGRYAYMRGKLAWLAKREAKKRGDSILKSAEEKAKTIVSRAEKEEKEAIQRAEEAERRAQEAEKRAIEAKRKKLEPIRDLESRLWEKTQELAGVEEGLKALSVKIAEGEARLKAISEEERKISSTIEEARREAAAIMQKAKDEAQKTEEEEKKVIQRAEEAKRKAQKAEEKEARKEKEIKSLEVKLAEAQKELERVQRKTQEVDKLRLKRSVSLEVALKKEEELKGVISQTQEEIQGLKNEADETKEEVEEAKKVLSGLQEEVRTVETKRGELYSIVRTLESEVEELEKRAEEAKGILKEFIERKKEAESAYQSSEEAKVDIDRRIEEKAQELASAEENLKALSERIAESEARLKGMSDKEAAAASTIEEARREAAAIMQRAQEEAQKVQEEEKEAIQREEEAKRRAEKARDREARTQEEIKRLEVELAEAQKELEKVQKSSQEADVLRLKRNVSLEVTLKKEEELKKVILSAQEEIQGLKNEADETKEEVEEAKKILGELQEEARQAEAKREKLEPLVRTLESEVEELEEKAKEARGILEELIQRKKEAEGAYQSSEEARVEIDRRIAKKAEELASAEESLKALSERIIESEARLKGMSDEETEAASSIEEARREAAEIMKKAQEEAQRMQDEENEAIQRAEEARRRAQEAEEKEARTQEEIKGLEVKLVEAQKELERVQDSSQEADELRYQREEELKGFVSRTQDELKSLQAEALRTKEEVEEAKSVLSKLQEEVRAAEEKREKLSPVVRTLESEVEELEEKAKEARGILEELIQRKKEAEGAYQSSEEARVEIDRRIAKKAEELASAEESLKALSERIIESEARLKGMSDEETEAASSIEEARREAAEIMKKAQEEIKGLEIELAKAREELEDIERTKTQEAEALVSEAQRRVGELEEQAEQLRSAAAVSEKGKISAEEEFERIKKKREEVEARIAEAEKNALQMKAEAEEFEIKAKEARIAAEEARKQAKAAEHAMVGTERMHKDIEKEIERRRKELADMEKTKTQEVEALVNEAQKRLTELEEQAEQLRLVAEEAMEKAKTAEEAAAISEEGKISAEEEFERIKKEREETEARIAEAEKNALQIEAKAAEFETKAKEARMAAEEAAQEAKAAEKAAQEAEARKISAEEELKTVEIRRGEAEARIVEIEKEIEQKLNEQNIKDKEMEERAASMLQKAKTEAEGFEAKAAEARQEAAAIKKKAQEEAQRMQEEENEAIQRIEEARRRAQEAEEKKNTALAEEKQLREEVVRLQRELNELKEDMSEKSALREKEEGNLDALRKERGKYEEEIRKSSSKLDSLKKEIAELEGEIKKLNIDKGIEEDISRRAKERERKREADYALKDEELSRREQVSKEMIDKASRELEELKKKADIARKVSEEARIKGEEAQKEIERIGRKKEVLLGDLKAVEAQTARAKDELEKLKKELEAVRGRIKDENKELEKALARKQSLEGAIKKDQQELDGLKRSALEAQGTIEKAEKRLKELERIAREAETRRKKAEKEAEEMETAKAVSPLLFQEDTSHLSALTGFKMMIHKDLADYNWTISKYFPPLGDKVKGIDFTRGLTGLIERMIREKEGTGEVVSYLDVSTGIGLVPSEVSIRYKEKGLKALTIDTEQWTFDDLPKHVTPHVLDKLEKRGILDVFGGEFGFYNDDPASAQLTARMDIITHFDSVQNIDNPLHTIYNMYNHLKKGGVMLAAYAITPNSKKSMEGFDRKIEKFCRLMGEATYNITYIPEEEVQLFTLYIHKQQDEETRFHFDPIPAALPDLAKKARVENKRKDLESLEKQSAQTAVTLLAISPFVVSASLLSDLGIVAAVVLSCFALLALINFLAKGKDEQIEEEPAEEEKIPVKQPQKKKQKPKKLKKVENEKELEEIASSRGMSKEELIKAEYAKKKKVAMQKWEESKQMGQVPLVLYPKVLNDPRFNAFIGEKAKAAYLLIETVSLGAYIHLAFDGWIGNRELAARIANNIMMIRKPESLDFNIGNEDALYLFRIDVQQFRRKKQIKVSLPMIERVPEEDVGSILVHEAVHLLPHQWKKLMRAQRLATPISRFVLSPVEYLASVSRKEADKAFRIYQKVQAMRVDLDFEAHSIQNAYRANYAKEKGYKDFREYLTLLVSQTKDEKAVLFYQPWLENIDSEGILREAARLILFAAITPAPLIDLVYQKARDLGKRTEQEIHQWILSWLGDPAYYDSEEGKGQGDLEGESVFVSFSSFDPVNYSQSEDTKSHFDPEVAEIPKYMPVLIGILGVSALIAFEKFIFSNPFFLMVISMVSMGIFAGTMEDQKDTINGELEEVLDKVAMIASEIETGEDLPAEEGKEILKKSIQEAFEKVKPLVREELDEYIPEFISRIAEERKSASKDESLLLARALRLIQLVYYSRNPVLTELNLVEHAWGGKANRILYGLDEPLPGHDEIAEVWHGSTVIKDGREESPSYVSDSAIKLGETVVQPLKLRELIEGVPGLLGGEHTEKPFFTKFLCTRFPDKIYLDFNSRKAKVTDEEFFLWLKNERENAEEILASLRDNITLEEFNEYLKVYEEWADFQGERKWLMSGGDTATRALVDRMKVFFTPEVNIHSLFAKTAETRADIVSVLNEITLEEGMAIGIPGKRLHGIRGLSLQSHPDEIVVNTEGKEEFPKNEAWIVISVEDKGGKKHLLIVEPQQTSNNTYSFADFNTPIVWDQKSQKPVMRKKATAEDIKSFVERGLNTEGINTPEDFIFKPVDITPSTGAVNAKVESLIEDTTSVWKSKYFVVHTISLLGGREKGEEASVEMAPVEGSYHALIVTKGKVSIKREGRSDIELTEGGYAFMPSAASGYTLEASTEAKVLKLFATDESYKDLERKGMKRPENVNQTNVSLDPLFELIQSTVNTRNKESIMAANRLNGFLAESNEMPEEEKKALLVTDDILTVSQISKMEKAVKIAADLVAEIKPSVQEDLEEVTESINRMEAESILSGIIILAREAEKKGKNLILGFETSWIRGIKPRLKKRLRELGVKNVELVEGAGASLAEDILARADREDLSNIVVLASKDTVSSPGFDDLRSTEIDQKAFLASMDPEPLRKLCEREGESFKKQLLIQMMSMLSVTLELASGKAPRGALPAIVASFDPEMRTLEFLPSMDLVNYNHLTDTIKAKLRALKSA